MDECGAYQFSSASEIVEAFNNEQTKIRVRIGKRSAVLAVYNADMDAPIALLTHRQSSNDCGGDACSVAAPQEEWIGIPSALIASTFARMERERFEAERFFQQQARQEHVLIVSSGRQEDQRKIRLRRRSSAVTSSPNTTGKCRSITAALSRSLSRSRSPTASPCVDTVRT